MRSLWAVLILCATALFGAPVAAAEPTDETPVELVELVYDFGRCNTDTLIFSTEAQVRLDITVRNQFDPTAQFRMPKFLLERDLPVTIGPVTSSVSFTVHQPGEYEFDIVSGADDRTMCTGLLISL
ncbi:hypothetical protein ACFO5K_27060 [Nocardia halotolerans]|uniref:Uncharacterized protein n=1 Tax=Nocardia halotolerans TaxID=1755878 RepID=A0ABV8VNU4_9NOCA